MPANMIRKTFAHHARRAFSLLELLVVIAILVIVMSIVIPSLGGVRNAARKSATNQLMASLSTSIGQYNLDQRRLPGYFSAREMGSNTNTDFSTMENMMLDLAGGITTETGAGLLTVGPGGQNGTVRVDPLRIGSPSQSASGAISKTYFTPDPKYFVKQNGAVQRAQPGQARDMPVLVDAWGSPILAWRQDIDPSEDRAFAQVQSRPNPACFYAQSNHAFLKARGLGKLAIDQTDLTSGSLLGGNDATTTVTMGALLGNPSFAFPNINPAKPSAARAPIVMHSAGINGVYLGRNEQGGKQYPTGLPYQPNLDPITGGGFDDFIVTAQ